MMYHHVHYENEHVEDPRFLTKPHHKSATFSRTSLVSELQ